MTVQQVAIILIKYARQYCSSTEFEQRVMESADKVICSDLAMEIVNPMLFGPKRTRKLPYEQPISKTVFLSNSNFRIKLLNVFDFAVL